MGCTNCATQQKGKEKRKRQDVYKFGEMDPKTGKKDTRETALNSKTESKGGKRDTKLTEEIAVDFGQFVSEKKEPIQNTYIIKKTIGEGIHSKII